MEARWSRLGSHIINAATVSRHLTSPLFYSPGAECAPLARHVVGPGKVNEACSTVAPQSLQTKCE
jgi:hypothetical protein